MPLPTPADAASSASDAPVRVAVIFASSIMRRGCEAILERRPEIRVVYSGTHESLDGLGPADADVAVVGVRPATSEAPSLVTVIAERGLPVLAVMPPGLRDTTAIEAGARNAVSGAHVTDDELTNAVLALVGSPPDLGPESTRDPTVLGRLSQREREVLAQVATGCTDREVGEHLGISMRTVQSHLDRIREKTGRRRRAELTALAYELGLVIQHD